MTEAEYHAMVQESEAIWRAENTRFFEFEKCKTGKHGSCQRTFNSYSPESMLVCTCLCHVREEGD
jgi:hypothetical protein